MSTKSTIAYGDKFHLYFDHADDKVHLRVEGAGFNCGPDKVTVDLSKEVLEAIANSRNVWSKCMELDRE
jgi:hypothetical protein